MRPEPLLRFAPLQDSTHVFSVGARSLFCFSFKLEFGQRIVSSRRGFMAAMVDAVAAGWM